MPKIVPFQHFASDVIWKMPLKCTRPFQFVYVFLYVFAIRRRLYHSLILVEIDFYAAAN